MLVILKRENKSTYRSVPISTLNKTDFQTNFSIILGDQSRLIESDIEELFKFFMLAIKSIRQCI